MATPISVTEEPELRRPGFTRPSGDFKLVRVQSDWWQSLCCCASWHLRLAPPVFSMRLALPGGARHSVPLPDHEVPYRSRRPERFSGRGCCISFPRFHGQAGGPPSQVHIANEIFSLSQVEIELATEIIAGFEAAAAEEKGAIRVDGMLNDALYYCMARLVLERRA